MRRRRRIHYNLLVIRFTEIVCQSLSVRFFLSKEKKSPLLAGRESLFILDLICVHRDGWYGHDLITA